MAKRYIVEDEAGDQMESFDTFIGAFDCVSDYETDDLLDGNYTPGFYFIRDTETDECHRIINTYED